MVQDTYEITQRAITNKSSQSGGIKELPTLYELRYLKDRTAKYVNRMLGGVRGLLVLMANYLLHCHHSFVIKKFESIRDYLEEDT